MAQNMPTIDVKKITLGPGIIKLGAYNPTAAGGTPSVDVGAVTDNAVITINRTILPVKQGNPRREVVAHTVEEMVSINFTGIEWNLPDVHRVIGGGVTPAVSGPTTTFNFGGDVGVTELALQYQHQMASGGTATVNLWKCRGDGNAVVTGPPDNHHTVSYTFIGVEGLSTWTNAALATNAKLCQIIYDAAP